MEPEWRIINLSKLDTIRLVPSLRNLEIQCADSGELDRQAVETVIMGQAARLGVVGVTLWTSPTMGSCWPLLLFPNVEGAAVKGKHVVSFEQLLELPKLRHLCLALPRRTDIALLSGLPIANLGMLFSSKGQEEVVGRCMSLTVLDAAKWQSSNLASLSGLKLKRVVFRRGSLESVHGLEGTLEHAMFMGCLHLRSFEGLNCRAIDIDACPHIDYESLGRAVGLRRLHLRSQHAIMDFAFISYCKDLEELTVNGCTVKADDFSAIERSNSLRDVFIPRLRPRVLEGISRKRDDGSLYWANLRQEDKDE